MRSIYMKNVPLSCRSWDYMRDLEDWSLLYVDSRRGSSNRRMALGFIADMACHADSPAVRDLAHTLYHTLSNPHHNYRRRTQRV